MTSNSQLRNMQFNPEEGLILTGGVTDTEGSFRITQE